MFHAFYSLTVVAASHRQRLIGMKMAPWSLASMPVEDHGWQNEFSRLDSNRRIFDLFEEVSKHPLPAEAKRTAKGK
jgi:hypothetical protein